MVSICVFDGMFLDVSDIFMPDFFVFPGMVDGPDVCVCVG